MPGEAEAYSRAVIRANPALVRDEEVDTLMRIRAERQRILTHVEKPVRFWSIIGEAALRTPIGGPKVMRGQLNYLADAVEQSNVTLQVLPYAVGAHAGLSGPFVLISYNVPGDTGIVFLENLTSSLYLETPGEVANYTLVFDALRSAPLNPAESLDFITALAEESTSD